MAGSTSPSPNNLMAQVNLTNAMTPPASWVARGEGFEEYYLPSRIDAFHEAEDKLNPAVGPILNTVESFQQEAEDWNEEAPLYESTTAPDASQFAAHYVKDIYQVGLAVESLQSNTSFTTYEDEDSFAFSHESLLSVNTTGSDFYDHNKDCAEVIEATESESTFLNKKSEELTKATDPGLTIHDNNIKNVSKATKRNSTRTRPVLLEPISFTEHSDTALNTSWRIRSDDYLISLPWGNNTQKSFTVYYDDEDENKENIPPMEDTGSITNALSERTYIDDNAALSAQPSIRSRAVLAEIKTGTKHTILGELEDGGNDAEIAEESFKFGLGFDEVDDDVFV